jgi:4-hydroxybenzoate polyprenyltransferase
LLYPYAKRVLAMPQAVLGVAFSFGIPMAFAAVQGGTEVAGRRQRRGATAAWGCCWATCSGCWPTTPNTRWSTATTTCASA